MTETMEPKDSVRELSLGELRQVSGGVRLTVLGGLASYIAGKAMDALLGATTGGGSDSGGGQISDTPAA